MADAKTAVTVMRAEADETHFCEVFRLLLALHHEGGYAPLDTDRAAENTYRVLCEGMTFLAWRGDEAIGVISLSEMPYWYSQKTFLQGTWFYVRPKHRRGKVGVLLLRAARDEAQARNKIALVTIDNPDRRPKRTRMSLMSQEAGFVPLGYTIKLN